MLAANDPPWFHPTEPQPKQPVLIVGAGIAGCMLAFLLDRQGWSVTLLDAGDELASAASGNSRAIVKPHLTRQTGPKANIVNQFGLQSFLATRNTVLNLCKSGSTIPHELSGLLQLVDELDNWIEVREQLEQEQSTNILCLTSKDASQIAGINLASAAIYYKLAGWVDLKSLCETLIAQCRQVTLRLNTSLSSIGQNGLRHDKWKVQLSCGDSDAFGIVVLATGPQTTQLLNGIEHAVVPPLTFSRGQTTRCATDAKDLLPAIPISGQRYLIPEHETCTVGATHHRFTDLPEIHCNPETKNQTENDVAINAFANIDSIGSISDALANTLEPIEHWASIRCSTPDRFPIVGPIANQTFFEHAYQNLKHGPRHQKFEQARYLHGLYALSGLGTRGATTAALCAEQLASQITGTASPNTCTNYARLLHPARFLVKSLVRSR